MKSRNVLLIIALLLLLMILDLFYQFVIVDKGLSKKTFIPAQEQKIVSLQ
ncbi:MAG: hypothetical protein JW946_01870 [Candidatus Omnitrophica bacterium]|nr:hypothetical protein [Candidatus Omnitrophota bacterium]